MDNLVPKYMCEGSEGPHVAVLKAFLLGNKTNDHRVTASPVFDRATKDALETWQRENGIFPSGCLNPETYCKMLQEFGVVMESMFRLIPGTTIFVQPNGEKIPWARDNE